MNNDIVGMEFKLLLTKDFNEACQYMHRMIGYFKRSFFIYGQVYLCKLEYMAPRFMKSPGVTRFSKRVSILFSNVAGPKDALRFCGKETKKMFFTVGGVGEIN